MQTLWLFNNSLEAAQDVFALYNETATLGLVLHFLAAVTKQAVYPTHFIPLRTGVLAWTKPCAATARLYKVYKLVCWLV